MTEIPVTLDMGENTVRFTDDGRVFVKDAIQMMIPEEEPQAVWDKIKREHPDILSRCKIYRTGSGVQVPIVNTDGWEKIVELLVDYLV